MNLIDRQENEIFEKTIFRNKVTLLKQNKEKPEFS